MPSIAPFSLSPIPCFRNSGAALPQTQRVQTFGITGVDGVGVHLLGYYGQPTTWNVIQYGSNKGLVHWFNLISATQGKVCHFVNDEGTGYPNQIVESISQPQKKTAIDLNGSEEIWTVQIRTRTV